MFCAIILISSLRNVNSNPNPLWGIFQNGPTQDVGKVVVKQPQKPQTRGLFSDDDEDAQVKLSSFTGGKVNTVDIVYNMSVCDRLF